MDRFTGINSGFPLSLIDISKSTQAVEKFSQTQNRAVLRLVKDSTPYLQSIEGWWSYLITEREQLVSLLFLNTNFDQIFNSSGNACSIKLKKYTNQILQSKNTKPDDRHLLKCLWDKFDAFTIERILVKKDEQLLCEFLRENKDKKINELEMLLFESRSQFAGILKLAGLCLLAEEAVRSKSSQLLQYLHLIAMGLQGEEKAKFTQFREEIAEKVLAEKTLSKEKIWIWPLCTQRQKEQLLKPESIPLSSGRFRVYSSVLGEARNKLFQRNPLTDAIREKNIAMIKRLLKDDNQYREFDFYIDPNPLTVLVHELHIWHKSPSNKVWQPFLREVSLKPLLIERLTDKDDEGNTIIDKLPNPFFSSLSSSCSHLALFFMDRESFNQIAESVRERHAFYLMCLELGCNLSHRALWTRLSELSILDLMNLIESSTSTTGEGTFDCFIKFYESCRTSNVQQAVYQKFPIILEAISSISAENISKKGDEYHSIISDYIDHVGARAYLDLILQHKGVCSSFVLVVEAIANHFDKLRVELAVRADTNELTQQTLSLIDESYGELNEERLDDAISNGCFQIVVRVFKRDKVLLAKRINAIFLNDNLRKELKKCGLLNSIVEAFLDQSDGDKLNSFLVFLYISQNKYGFIIDIILHHYSKNEVFRPVLWKCLRKLLPFSSFQTNVWGTTYFVDYIKQGEQAFYEPFRESIKNEITIFKNLYEKFKLELLGKHRELQTAENRTILLALSQHTDYFERLIGRQYKLKDIMHLALKFELPDLLATIRKNYPGFCFRPYMPQLLSKPVFMKILRTQFIHDLEEHFRSLDVTQVSLEDVVKNSLLFMPNQIRDAVHRIPKDEAKREDATSDVCLMLKAYRSPESLCPNLSSYKDMQLAFIIPAWTLDAFIKRIGELNICLHARLLRYANDDQRILYLCEFPFKPKNWSDVPLIKEIALALKERTKDKRVLDFVEEQMKAAEKIVDADDRVELP